SLQPALPTLDNQAAGEVKVAGQRIDKQGENATTNEVVEPNTKNAKAAAQNSVPVSKPANTPVQAAKPNASATTPPATQAEVKPAQATNTLVATNNPGQQAKPALADQVSSQVKQKNELQNDSANRPRSTSPNATPAPPAKEMSTSPGNNPKTVSN